MKKFLMDENLACEISMFERCRGWLFIPLYESICVGFFEGSQKVLEFPEGNSIGNLGNLETSAQMLSYN